MRHIGPGLMGDDRREDIRRHEPARSERFISALFMVITFASFLTYFWQSLVIVKVFEEFNRLLDKFLF